MRYDHCCVLSLHITLYFVLFSKNFIHISLTWIFVARSREWVKNGRNNNRKKKRLNLVFSPLLSLSLTHLFLLHIMLFLQLNKPYIICHFLSMLHYRVVVDCIAIYFIHFFSLSQWAARFSIRSIKATFCEILKIFHLRFSLCNCHCSLTLSMDVGGMQ